MTPEAVIHRYLTLAHRRPLPRAALSRLIELDADLLGYWLRACRRETGAGSLARALDSLTETQICNLIEAQAWQMAATSGSARLAFDQWHTVLAAACLAEELAQAEGLSDPQGLRMRALLGISGVTDVPDSRLARLHRFRGLDAALLEDTDAELRIFAVVDALELQGESSASALCKSLLQREEHDFLDAVDQARQAAARLITEAGLADDPDAEWSEKLWLRQQIHLAARLVAAERSSAHLNDVHALVCRTVIGTVPALFLTDESADRLELVTAHSQGPAESGETDEAPVRIRINSTHSVIARAFSTQKPQRMADGIDVAVVDRTVMLALECEEATAIPLPGAEDVMLGVLVCPVQTETDSDYALYTYAEELGFALAVLQDEGESTSLAEQFRTQEQQRLREIVHEVNNPLSIVRNYLHILQLRLQHEPVAVEQLDTINTELERASQLVQTIREVPELHTETTSASRKFTESDVSQLARRQVELHQGYAAEHDVELEFSGAHSTAVVTTDESALSQVLTNLIRNAIEASAAGDEVEVSIRTPVFRSGVRGIELVVDDEGQGIPEAVQQQLFAPKHSAKGGDHAGLGLHLVGRLVDEIGASIDVRTTAGRGTSFAVFLPAVSPRS